MRVELGCIDALQSSGIVPIVEKVRGLIKNVWGPDISHQPAVASREGQSSESSSAMRGGGSGCVLSSLVSVEISFWIKTSKDFALFPRLSQFSYCLL